MFARVLNLLALLLVPALLVVSGPSGAHALFECSMTRTVQTHCCCAGKAEGESNEAPAQLKQGDCCSECWVDAKAPAPGHESSPATPSVLAQAYERVRVRDLYAVPARVHSFALREAPRAIGPPLIYLYRVLRL